MPTPRQTTAYYRVRSVLASRGSRAITLEPGQFIGDSASETVRIDGQDLPKVVERGPAEPGSEWEDLGGKMTELRLEGEDVILDLDPDDLVLVVVKRLDRDVEPLEENVDVGLCPEPPEELTYEEGVGWRYGYRDALGIPHPS